LVAPRAGAWIEMIKSWRSFPILKRRAPRGRVD